jgi:hypothetical protein
VIKGAVVGLGLGGAYFILCTTRDFFAIMVGFPALLGGGLASLVSSNRSSGVGAFFARLGNGLVAGVVLGFVYMYGLNFILDSFVPWEALGGVGYVYSMWRGGLPAMGFGSAIFLVLLRWAVGLVRVRLDPT